MVPLIFSIATATFGAGMVAGLFVHHKYVFTPLFTSYEGLVKLVSRMKRRGFVEQYDFAQVKRVDPSSAVIEY